MENENKPKTDKAFKPVVLVTGSTSGIGLELARLLWHSEYRVIITARTQSIQSIQNEAFYETERFRIQTLDILSLEDIHALIERINQEWGGVDILINNAGISYRSVVEEMTDQDEWQQMATNYLGPMCLIRSVLPMMRQKGYGRIINISSVGGMMAMPTMASYSASKFALEGATEALWYELKPWNIHVSLIQPGFIHSESFRRVFFSQTYQLLGEASPYQEYYSQMSKFIERMMTLSPVTAESIARLILRLMKQKQPALRVPATPDAHFFALMRRILPRSWYHSLLYHLLPGIRHWVKHARSK